MSLASIQAAVRRAPPPPPSRWGGRLTLGGCSGGGGADESPDGAAAARASHGGAAFGLCSSAYVTPAWWSLWALLSHRTSRNYRSFAFLVPRTFEKLTYAALLAILYWGIGE